MKNINITVTFQKIETDRVLRSEIIRAGQSVFRNMSDGKIYSLSILICDDAEIKNLNNTYRGFDHPTDVLSFPSGINIPDTGEVYLGDIAISFPTAIRQAQKYKHSVNHEISLLTVHGILHLLGFDHDTDDSEQAMWNIQRTLMHSLGYDFGQEKFD